MLHDIYMKRQRHLSTAGFRSLMLVFLVGAAGTLRASIDFEGFPDSTTLAAQYPGLTFTNAIILTAGISLNEFEFPPHSGVNVASDNGGPITIDFATPITSFSGYFTYIEPLTLTGFDVMNSNVVSANSLFLSNDALFGDLGSSPNEVIQIAFGGGISSVTITGDPAGSSFVMDDVTYTTASTTPTPEPSSGPALMLPITLIIFLQWRRALDKS